VIDLSDPYKQLAFLITDTDRKVTKEVKSALKGTLNVRTRPDPSVLPIAVVRDIDEGYHTFFEQPKSYIRYSRSYLKILAKLDPNLTLFFFAVCVGFGLDDLGNDDDRIDYELDSDDEKWLEGYNSHIIRQADPKLRISEDDLEFALDSLEKQAHIMVLYLIISLLVE